MQQLVDVLTHLRPETPDLDVVIVVHLRLQGRMALRQPVAHAIDRDVVQLVPMVIVEVEIDEILNGSTLYGRYG